MVDLGKSHFDEGLDSGSPFKAGSMAEGVPAPRTLGWELWIANADLVAEALLDPFVVALGQGILPKSVFQSYIAQDAYFLSSFARGYDTAGERCRSDRTLTPSVAANVIATLEDLKAGVLEELKLHDQCGQSSSQAGNTFQPTAATSRYTEWLEVVINDSDSSAATILAAMVPCLRLYAYLGCTLRKAFPEANQPYAEWIETYSHLSYLQLPAMAEGLFDVLVPSNIGGGLGGEHGTKPLFDTYRKAMQMEVDFFASQPFKFPPRPIKLLVIDFDDTCTAQDTSALIAETAIEASAKASEDPEASRSKGQQMLEELVFNYVSKRDGLLDEILPDVPWNEGEEGSEEFDMTWLGDFLDRLSDFDREMNSVVVESGILAGIKRGTMSDVGARVAMRPGCLKFLHHAVHTGIPTAIVSVNWSAELVVSALQHHSSASSQESEYHLPGGAVKLISGGFETDIPTPGTVHVYANDLEYFGESSTGGIRRRCECAVDKGRLFEDLLLGVAVAEVKPEVETETVENVRGSSVPRGLSVYIGDSMTDLSALISADVGIILGSNRHIRHVAAVAGLQIRPLVTYPMDVESAAAHFDSETHPVIYEASSWSEVYAFVFGRQRERAPQSPEQKDRPSVPTTPADQEDHPGKWCTMSVPNPVRLLSIAGSDSGGGAGIQADIKTSSALGVYSTTAITAITAQNSHGVANIFSTPIDILRAQIRAVLSDIGADAIKTGMLPSTQAVEAVADELSGFSMHERPHIVVDPVLMATSGDALAEPGVAQAVLQHLFPLATVVTPNTDEARMLLSAAGLASDQYLSLIADLQGVRAAAREIHALGPKWVLIKGGHLDAPHEQGPIWNDKDDTTVVNLCPLPHCNASAPRMVVDVLFDGTRYYEFWAPFIDTANTHGTGCTLATAIAIKLAEGVGLNVPEAVQAAKKYVWETLLASSGLTIGSGPNQAMLHAYQRNGVRAPMLRQNPLDLRMYVITDELLIEKNCGGLTLEEAVHAAIRGGATIVQIREKELGGGEFLKRAARVLDVCREHGVPLIVNDRVDIALVIGADGVHVGQEDMGVEAVRRLMGDGAIIGVSAKTVEQARAAEKGGADYIGAGAIFPTGTKSDSSVIGLDGLRAVCRAVSIPVVAVGGLNASTVKLALTEGEANGVAVVSAAFGSPDVQSATASLRKIVNTVLDESKLKSEPKSPAP